MYLVNEYISETGFFKLETVKRLLKKSQTMYQPLEKFMRFRNHPKFCWRLLSVQNI